MNLRHVAVVALVGWYLIAPPPITEDTNHYDPKAPLSEWEMIGKFDTIEDCRTYPVREHEIMHGFYTDPTNHLSESDERRDGAAWDHEMEHAQCVSTDETRLKSK
jgi:hypothetical protein